MVVALAITAGVYGAVALIVKMDDVGLRLAQTREGPAASFGRGLVRAMPVVLSVLSKVGIAAMLWVGGHILLVGLDELGVSALYDAVHHLEEDVHDALGAVGGVGAWLTNTAASAILGLVVGAIVVAVMHRRSAGADRRRATTRSDPCSVQPRSTDAPKSSGTASMSTMSVGCPRLIRAPRRTPMRRKPARS